MRALALLFVVACAASTTTAPVANTAPPAPSSTEAWPVSEADCQAFASAAAFGMAVVASATPDCSGIGNQRIVLDVVQLAAGGPSSIETLVARQPLGARPQLRAGDILVTTIDPHPGAAATVSCVPMPAHEGVASHWLRVESEAAGRQLLDALLSGRACRPAAAAVAR